VLAIHKKFCLLYLTKFAASFPDDETLDEWCELWGAGLAGFSGEQIKEGLRRTALESQWPPTLSEFRGFCGLPQSAFPKLPPPTKTRSQAQEYCMSEVRKLAIKKPGKWWAEKIITRHELHGDVMPVAVKFAQEALGQEA